MADHSSSLIPAANHPAGTPGDEHDVLEEDLQQVSLSNDPYSTSSTATTLPGYLHTPPYSSEDRSSTPQSEKQISDIPRSGTGSTTASTTSRTRERLRLAELKCEELLGQVDKERAIAEKLKQEGRAVERCDSKAELRIRELKKDAFAAAAESPQRSTEGLFKKVCSTDLLFLIDTTSSMSGHIRAAKEQVVSVVNSIEEAFFNEAEVRIAVVGYKDHSDSPNIQFHDFTTSADQARHFVTGLKATGGADAPEDVLGGIRQAVNASWKHQTRCIIHIADAPPHGRIFHTSSTMDDSYPTPGTEPHHLTYEPLLRQMIELNINYALLRINNSTDLMAFNFFKLYLAASAECSLLGTNMYNSQAKTLQSDQYSGPRGSRNSKRSAKSGLLFEESQLGTSYSELQHLVLKNVTTSASRTAVRLSGSPARTKPTSDKKLLTNLLSIEEDDNNTKNVVLDNAAPQWARTVWFNEILMVEGFTPDVGVHGASTLNDMMASDDNIKLSITELTIRKRSRPFAQGAMRVAFYAKTAASTNRYVVKSFKKSGKRLAHVAEDMQCQALCKAFALEFNAISGEVHSIDFLVSTCLKGLSRRVKGDECLSLEPFIEGAYVKYNNNCGYVNKDDDSFNQMAQAFSHFTFERSRGKLLVSDIQGVGHVLTDPAIHTADPQRFKLTDTNLGKEGFKFFFSTHKCNHICTRLGLKSKAYMIKSGKFEFRETWPSMDNTVCCSNKLCGKIVRVLSAKKSDKFPGYHWCDGCWPQLEAFTTQKICVARGPHHTFEASEFFHESQGEKTPRKCPEHRESNAELQAEAPVLPESAPVLSSAPTPVTGPMPVMAALFGPTPVPPAELQSESSQSPTTSPRVGSSPRMDISPFFGSRSPFGPMQNLKTPPRPTTPLTSEEASPLVGRLLFGAPLESRYETWFRGGAKSDVASGSKMHPSTVTPAASRTPSGSDSASISRPDTGSRFRTAPRSGLTVNNIWARLKSATRKSSLSRRTDSA